MAGQVERIEELINYLSADERAELDALLAASTPVWVPQPGQQTAAYESAADIVFYGGAAGGGKTDLLIGLALTNHYRSIIFRREGTQLQAIIDRLTEIRGNRDGYNGQERIWRLPDRQVELGSVKDLGDELRYQGRPHDFIGFDEICHFLEAQVRFLMGWLRTTREGQRCRVVFTGNPPTNADGEWVIRFFGPWLDPNHPNPAKPGELRWYAMVDGKEVERPDGKPFRHGSEIIKPKSRTFIPSRVTDNAFLLRGDYMAQLQALPEPLRSQMLEGDFLAGLGDDPWQVIPTAWVEAAMARWREDGWKDRSGKALPMDSVGADISRGGTDDTVVASRHGTWYAPLRRFPGQQIPDGPAAAAQIILATRDRAPMHIDLIGVGTSVYDHLNGNGLHAVPVHVSEAVPGARDKSGRLAFVNRRAMLWWRFREALDPSSGEGVALPPDSRLKADLCAPRWKLTARGVQIESKEEVRKRIGRSTDSADAVILAYIPTPKREVGPEQVYAETAFDPFTDGRQLDAET